jgi:hypothetical protein
VRLNKAVTSVISDQQVLPCFCAAGEQFSVPVCCAAHVDSCRAVGTDRGTCVRFYRTQSVLCSKNRHVGYSC